MKPGTPSVVVGLLSSALVLAGAGSSPFQRKLALDRQPVHVLNRLAFGAQPGDLEAVRKVGVARWIQQQLHPEQIDESPTLHARLEPLDTLQLTTWEIFERYAPILQPSRPTVAQLLTADQARRLTSGPLEERRAILQALTPELRTQVLGVAPVEAIKDLPEWQDEAGRARAAEEQARAAEARRLRPTLDDLLTRDEQTRLTKGPMADKLALLASFDAGKRTQVLRVLPAAAVPDGLQREALAARQPQQVATAQAIEARLLRARYSNRQLEEVLVDFWMNHFNVFTEKGPVRTLITSYERDAIRPHVLGKFHDLLLASARHPAMLFYLDNWQSRAAPDPARVPAGQRPPALNENYGRELMELHTLGVDGGYTQADVINVARSFTGWTIFDPNRYGEFQFNPANHDRGEKLVLGHVIPRGGGEDDALQVLDILARHPSTARFISRQLAQRFVADDPPQSLVDRMARTFTDSDGDLREVMDTLLTSREFLSEGAWQAKIKSPLEMTISALRALDADLSDPSALAQRLSEMGEPIYGKSEPTGYPNTGEAWASSAGLIGRIRFANALTAGQIKGVKVTNSVVAGKGIKAALLSVLGFEPSATTVKTLEEKLQGTALTPATLAAVIIAAPDFQKR